MRPLVIFDELLSAIRAHHCEYIVKSTSYLGVILFRVRFRTRTFPNFFVRTRAFPFPLRKLFNQNYGGYSAGDCRAKNGHEELITHEEASRLAHFELHMVNIA